MQRQESARRGAVAPDPEPTAGTTTSFADAINVGVRELQLSGPTPDDPSSVRRLAAQGLEGAGSTLPHLAAIQRSFGTHDVSHVRSFFGDAARSACEGMGANAYASGTSIAFRGATADLHTTAHEAAHIVQQRAGVSLSGGVGQAGDVHERHADDVADLVVRGESAEALLDRYQNNRATSSPIQMQTYQEPGPRRPPEGQPDDRPFHGGTGPNSFAELSSLMATYTEGPASVGPLELLRAYIQNGRPTPASSPTVGLRANLPAQPAIAEHVKFGPNSVMTRAIQNDESIVDARRRFMSARTDIDTYHTMGLSAFVRETEQASLPMHFLGSFTVQVSVTPSGQALFVVMNSTGRASMLRNPSTNVPTIPDATREQTGPNGNMATLHQLYYWTEDIAELGRRAAPPMQPPSQTENPVERALRLRDEAAHSDEPARRGDWRRWFR